MRNKKLVLGIIVLIAFAGFILFVRAVMSKARDRKTKAPAAQARKGHESPPRQKIVSKGKGALTVKILNSKNMEVPVRIRAFRAIDGKSSVYTVSSVGGRMQEVAPGTYDLEVDSVPQKIFKNIKVVKGKETVKNLGCVTGSVIVKTANARKTAAYYPIRIFYSGTGDMITTYMTNRAIEIVPGIYDIEIGTSPRIYKKKVKVTPGKETIIDMGCVAGSLTVKTVDEDGKDVRFNIRITRADTNEIASSTISNRPIDLGKGRYNVEVLSKPKESKRDIKVDAGKESVVEFVMPSKSVAGPKR